MHVAFVVNNYPPRLGGVELHVAALARALQEHGHQVTVVTLFETASRTQEGGIEVVRLPERFRVGDVLGFPPPGTARQLRGLLIDKGVDLVSVHTRFFPLTWLGVAAGRRVGIPTVLTEHGSDYVSSPSPLITAASRAVDWSAGRRALRGASKVLGVSEDVVAFVKRLAGVEAELFYNAIELAPAVPGERPELPVDREPLPAVDREPRPAHLVFVGRLVAGKGWDTFIRTVGELRGRGHEVSGTVLGGGPDEEAARQMAAVSGGVQVRGRVKPAQVAAELAGATLVNPTTLSEGFQTTLLEALAAGGQVVTYPVPGARTLAADGAPVTITDSASEHELIEAVAGAVETPGERYPREKLQAWSWQARAAQFEALARKLIA